MNYFILFRLPIFYSISNNLIRSRFQDLQRKFHPDRFYYQLEKERLIALKTTLILNKAYSILKDPLKRAEYILSLFNIDYHHKKNTIFDNIFLHTQIELFDEFDSIKNKKNMENSLIKFNIKLNNIIKQNNIIMIQSLNNKQWEKAYNSLYKLRFLKKLQQKTEKFKEKLLNFN
ncbi:Co-chaperone protein HscB [Serratia symbiotica]|nr:Co-chaperone protein HscB [Serratia symbiotica]